MDFEDEVVVASFTDHASAEAAVSLLASEGVEAYVRSDDAGGELPNLDLAGSARVVVARQSADFARQLLNVEES